VLHNQPSDCRSSVTPSVCETHQDNLEFGPLRKSRFSGVAPPLLDQTNVNMSGRLYAQLVLALLVLGIISTHASREHRSEAAGMPDFPIWPDVYQVHSAPRSRSRTDASCCFHTITLYRATLFICSEDARNRGPST
jgi:hypothetical protein